MSEQGTASIAETGVYVDKLSVFEPKDADRVLHAKGREVFVFHPKNKKEQRQYRPEKEAPITVPAGYAVRVVKAWVAWSSESSADDSLPTGS